MIPYMKKNDIQMFYKYLNQCKSYFEYGCGGSTYQANSRNNIELIYCVESDKEWIDKLEEKIQSDKIRFMYIDVNTKPKNWGHPGKDANNTQKKSYSNAILQLSNDERNNIDIVMIDGRFRVACCLKLLNEINDNCIIAFDDFLNRSQYHIVLEYFDIIDKTKDNCMAILKKKENVNSCPDNLIQKYEVIAD